MTAPAVPPLPSAADLPPPPPAGRWPDDGDLLHVDAQLIVCDKPAGLLAVPGRGEDGQRCLLAWLQHRFPDADTVHRLDMATSGLMVFARGKAAQRALSRQFEQRSVEKRYQAIVAGHLPPSPGWTTIDLPLACDWPRRPRQQVDPVHGRPSLTRWRLIAHEGDTSRVALEPVTGRSHQLRVHLQAIGHPIVGDHLYAPPPWDCRADRLLLHAEHLAFAHPEDGRRMAFERPAPF